jgi:hypothetical protein
MIDLPTDWLDQLKRAYPRRCGAQGWGALPRLIHRLLCGNATFEQLKAAADSYRGHCEREGLSGTNFVMQARTFFGRDNWWQESYEPEAKPKLPHQIALERRWQALKERADQTGFRNPTAVELSVDPSVYEDKLKRHELSHHH